MNGSGVETNMQPQGHQVEALIEHPEFFDSDFHLQGQVFQSSRHNQRLGGFRADELCLQKELQIGSSHEECFQKGFHENSSCSESSKLKLSGLLSQTVGELEMAEFWLLDSGASRSVISTRFINQYQVVRERNLEVPLGFTTASGEAMSISREAQVRCQLEVMRGQRIMKQTVILRVLVAEVQHNLLSTNQMQRMGWQIVFSPDDGISCELRGAVVHPIVWAGVPWIKIYHPDSNQSHHDKSSSESPSRKSKGSSVSGNTIEEPPGLEQVLGSD